MIVKSFGKFCMSPFDNKPLKTFFKTWAKNLGPEEN